MANLNLLQEHSHWFIDGTFKVAPALFFQIFFIHALVDGSAYPLVYVMMSDKTEENYKRIFRKLKEIKPSLNPSSIMSDYEKASQIACLIVFPDTRLVGCFFHLGQSMSRKVQDLNLAASYCEVDNFRICVKTLLALAFDPVADVLAEFYYLAESFPPVLAPLVDYWEDTYIGRQRKGRRANPRFALQLWNVRDRAVDNFPRTNNLVVA